MKLYVRAKSKKEINEWLSTGKQVVGMNYSAFGGGGEYLLKDVPDGTVVAVYDKMSGGNPVSKSGGIMKNGKLI